MREAAAADDTLTSAVATLHAARPFIVLLVALKGLLVATAFIPPAIAGLFIDEVLVGRNAERLWLLVGALVAVYVIETLLKVVETWAQNRAVNRVVFRQRMRVFRAVQRLTWSELMRRAPGELLRRVEEDTEQLGALLLQRIERIFNWGLVVVGGVVCVTVSWQLALAGTVLTATIWLLGRWFKRKASVRSRALREAVGKWSAWLHESLLGWREVRMLAIEDVQNARMAAWLRRIDPLRGANFTFTFLQMALGRLQETYVSQATLYVLGGVLIFLGTLTLGGLIAFMRYFARVLDAVDQINALNVQLGAMLPPVDSGRTLPVIPANVTTESGQPYQRFRGKPSNFGWLPEWVVGMTGMGRCASASLIEQASGFPQQRGRRGHGQREDQHAQDQRHYSSA